MENGSSMIPISNLENENYNQNNTEISCNSNSNWMETISLHVFKRPKFELTSCTSTITPATPTNTTSPPNPSTLINGLNCSFIEKTILSRIGMDLYEECVSNCNKEAEQIGFPYHQHQHQHQHQHHYDYELCRSSERLPSGFAFGCTCPWASNPISSKRQTNEECAVPSQEVAKHRDNTPFHSYVPQITWDEHPDADKDDFGRREDLVVHIQGNVHSVNKIGLTLQRPEIRHMQSDSSD